MKYLKQIGLVTILTFIFILSLALPFINYKVDAAQVEVQTQYLPLLDSTEFTQLKPQRAFTQSVRLTPCEVVQITDTEGAINDEPIIGGLQSRIAFWSTFDGGQNSDGNTEIFLYDGNIIQVTETTGNILGGFNLSPSMNNNGDRIIFFSDNINSIAQDNATGNFEIFIAEVDYGTTTSISITQVTRTDNGFNIEPIISRNGLFAVFGSDEDLTGTGTNIDDTNRNRGNTEIFRVNLTDLSLFSQSVPPTDTVFLQVTDSLLGLNGTAVSNRDGTHIAFISDRNLTGSNPDGTPEVFLALIDNGTVTIRQISVHPTGFEARSPTITGDGNLVAYIVNGLGTSELHVAEIDSLGNGSPHSLSPVVSQGINKDPSLSSDGRFLAFASNQDLLNEGGGGPNTDGSQEIFLMDLNTPELAFFQVTSSTNILASADAPSINNDGSLMAFTANFNITGQNPDLNREVFRANCNLTGIQFTKSASPDPTIAGDLLTYTIQITNNTSFVFQSPVISDPLRPEVTFVNVDLQGNVDGICSPVPPENPVAVRCNLADMTSGSLASVILTVLVDPGFRLPLFNEAILTGVTPEGATSIFADITTDVIGVANLDIVKTPLDTPVAGLPLTYTITISNPGPSDATNLNLTDAFYPNVISVTDITDPCFLFSSDIVCSPFDLLVNEQTTITVVVGIPAYLTGTITNTLTISGNEVGTIFSQNQIDNIAQSVDLSIFKETTNEDIISGTPVTYTIIVTNNGPSIAPSVVITDQPPLELTFASAAPDICVEDGGTGELTCSVGALLVDEIFEMTLTFTSSNEVTSAVVINAAGVYDEMAVEIDSADNISYAFIDLVKEADLEIDKIATPAVAGWPMTYTIIVTNHGPSKADNVLIVDDLPSTSDFSYTVSTSPNCTGTGPIECNINSILPGASAQVKIAGLVDVDATDDLINNVEVSTVITDPNPANDTDTHTAVIGTAVNLNVIKASNPTTVVAGELLTYEFTVINPGPSNAATVTLMDTLPAGVTYNSSDNDDGGSCNYDDGTRLVTCNWAPVDAGTTFNPTIVVTVTSGQLDPISNTVTVSSPELEINPLNNTSSVVTIVDTQADLSISKVSDPTTVNAGDLLTYTLTIINDGPSDALNVVVTDTLPPSFQLSQVQIITNPGGGSCSPPANNVLVCNLGTMTASNTIDIIIQGTVASSETGTINNSAEVSSITDDNNTGNNQIGPIPTIVQTRSDIRPVKEGSVYALVAGQAQPFTYTITVFNDGPSNATNIDLIDTLPSGVTVMSLDPPNPTCSVTNTVTVTCPNLGDLVSGDQLTVTIVVNVGADAPSPLTNIVTATATQIDPTSDNDTFTLNTPVGYISDLAITKQGPTTTVAGGPIFDYTLTYTNSGPSEAENVLITDTLPGDFKVYTETLGIGCNSHGYIPANPPNLGGVFTCSLGTLVVNDTGSFIIQGNFQKGTPNNVLGINRATITLTNVATDIFDSNVSNNFSTVNTLVEREYDLEVTKNAPSEILAGELLEYTITVINNGPSVASDVWLSDPIPANTTFVNVITTGNPSPIYCPDTSPTLHCRLVEEDMNTGINFQRVITLVVMPNVNFTDGGILTNTVVITSNPNETELDFANNTYTATTIFKQAADLVITKTAAISPATAGLTTTYQIEVTNLGPSSATNVEVVDNLPGGLNYNTSSGQVDTCNGTTAVTCNLGTIGAGNTKTFNLVVNIPSSLSDDTTINTATASSEQIDPTPASSTAPLLIERHATLLISKSANKGTVSYDDLTLSYTINVTNTGPSDVASLTITDVLDSDLTYLDGSSGCGAVGQLVTCNIGSSLSAGNSTTRFINVEVSSDTLQPTIANTAYVTATEALAIAGSNTVNTNITLANLVITKTASAAGVPAGGTLTYTIEVYNQGPSAATSVQAQDTVPNNMLLVSTIPGSASCIGDPNVICTWASIPAYSSQTVQLVVNASASITETIIITNTANLNNANEDPDLPDSSSIGVIVGDFVDLDITQLGPSPSTIDPDDIVTFPVVVQNIGTLTATDVAIDVTINRNSTSDEFDGMEVREATNTSSIHQ